MTIHVLPLLLVYFFSLLLLTMLGARRKIGRMRLFLIGLFLTPVTGLIVYLTSQPAHLLVFSRYRCERCGVDFTEPLHECPYCRRDGVKTRLQQVEINCI